MSEEEGEEENGDPEILHRVVPKDLRVVQEFNDRSAPDLRAIDARGNHNGDRDKKAFSGAIEVAEIECMGVVGFPGRKVHCEARDESSVSTKLRRAIAHGSSLEKTSQSAVQRIDSVAEES